MGDSATLEQTAGNIEEEVTRVLEQAKELQDSAASLLSKASNDEQSLRLRAISLDSSIRRLHSLIDSLLSNKILDPKLADKACIFLSLFSFLSFPFITSPPLSFSIA